MIVYHGSYCRVERPELTFSREKLDFGKGFYITPIREQAERWSKRFLRARKAAILSTYFGYIASYSYENERLTKQWEKQTSDFLYQRVNNRIEFDNLHHEGFGCITAGKEHIYAFSQYLSEKQMKENGILVFDKSGKLLSCLRIKNPVVYLVTDSREENLYAVSYDIEEQHLYLSKLKTTL